MTHKSSGYGYECPKEHRNVLCRVIPGVNTYPGYGSVRCLHNTSNLGNLCVLLMEPARSQPSDILTTIAKFFQCGHIIPGQVCSRRDVVEQHDETCLKKEKKKKKSPDASNNTLFVIMLLIDSGERRKKICKAFLIG